MKFFRSLSILAFLTLASSILGYVRDFALAANFGASGVTDAYFAAFLIPNTLYMILLSGSLATIFVPVFIQARREDRMAAWRLASTVLFLSTFILTAFVLVAILLRHYWFPVFFPGFDADTTQLAEQLVWMLMPMLIFTGASSLLTAMLHSFDHFTMPALAPIAGNIIVIAAIFLLSRRWGIQGVALAVTASMVVQMAIQLPILRRKGARLFFGFDWQHPGLKRLVRLSLPLMAYLLVAYAAVFLERNLASQLVEGTVSAFSYAVRIFSIPVGIFAGSIGTVIYPRLSNSAAHDDGGGFAADLSRAFGATLFILLPFSIWLGIHSSTVISFLFGYGSFSQSDVALTATVLQGYTLGMVATGIARILQRAFYALQNTTIPLIVELVNLVAYAALAFSLTRSLGAHGLAAARGISFLAVAIALIVAFRYRHANLSLGASQLLVLVMRHALAVLPAALLWLLLTRYAPLAGMMPAGRWGDGLQLALSTGAGLGLFVMMAHLLGIEELALLRENVLTLRKTRFREPS